MWHNIDVGGWPAAIRSAELAHGTLVTCGPGVRLASWPETAEARAYAARQAIGDQLMPVMMAAAWVWGCTRTPGQPFLCSTRGNARPKLQWAPELRVHEFRYELRDLEACGEVTLPTPARTACDLIRLTPEVTASTVVTTRLLLLRAGLSYAEWREELMRGPGRGRARALRRLESLEGLRKT